MRHAALLLCLLACEHDPKTAPREPPCIADSLPALHRDFKERAECTAANRACRDSCAAGDADVCFARGLALEHDEATEAQALDLFASDERARIPDLMARACSGGDDDACGDHATVEETFH